MLRTALVAIVVCLGTSCAGKPAPAPPLAEAPRSVGQPRATPAPSLAIQLVDGKTRAVLAGVTAAITSSADGGAPRTWEGRADAEGGVHVPGDMIADVMTVKVAGYRPATASRQVGRRPKRIITVRLVPE